MQRSSQTGSSHLLAASLALGGPLAANNSLDDGEVATPSRIRAKMLASGNYYYFLPCRQKVVIVYVATELGLAHLRAEPSHLASRRASCVGVGGGSGSASGRLEQSSGRQARRQSSASSDLYTRPPQVSSFHIKFASYEAE